MDLRSLPLIDENLKVFCPKATHRKPLPDRKMKVVSNELREMSGTDRRPY